MDNQKRMSDNVFIMGILGVICSILPYLNFTGIIISFIGLVKKNKYMKQGLVLEGRANTGRILLIIGTVLGIVLTILYSIIAFFLLFIYKNL